jgi:hypothetical protein
VQAGASGRIIRERPARPSDREIAMSLRPLPPLLTHVGALTLGALLLALPVAQAADGLQVPAAESVWPQWQARVTLQAAAPSALALGPLALMPPAESGVSRQVRAGAVLGDYVFAAPRFGQFRATSGLMLGSTAGASAWLPWSSGGESASRPYLGLGYSGSAWLPGLSLVADVGLVSENFSALGQWARAAAGSQSFDQTLREMRWTPVLQIGLRWAF